MATIELTNENFEQEILKSTGTVVVDFWASWCGPCKMLSPVLEKFATANPNIKVGKVNVDEQKSLAQHYEIMTIPTIIIFQDGKEVKTASGYMSQKALEEMVK